MSAQLEELRTWLTEKKKLNQPIPLDVDLIETGIMDSLLFAEYVMMIEELSGIEIEVDDDLLDQVKSLQQVYKYYFDNPQANASAMA
ncbi:phosphopantetheine-binding protein [Marinicella sp. W31]|uniref:phosphopantetheine-binding protein n=1 Tax=Marinicella sp. W31 TaxID=3023713 RepID=UPI003757104C